MTINERRWSEHRIEGKEADMSLTLITVMVDCGDPGQQAGFWSEALSYDVRERNTDASSTAETLQGMLDSWFASAAVNDVSR